MVLDFQAALGLVQTSGYLLIFLVMIFEGPLITIASAFAASMGVLNVYLIFLLALAGDIVGDFVFYFLGRFARHTFLDKYGFYFGITKEKILYLEDKLRKRFVLSFIFIKNTPIFCQPGLVAMGTMRISLKKFLLWSLLITLPRSIFLTCLGYFGGIMVISLLNYFKFAEYLVVIFVVLGVLVYLILKEMQKREIRILEKNHSVK